MVSSCAAPKASSSRKRARPDSLPELTRHLLYKTAAQTVADEECPLLANDATSNLHHVTDPGRRNSSEVPIYLSPGFNFKIAKKSRAHRCPQRLRALGLFYSQRKEPFPYAPCHHVRALCSTQAESKLRKDVELQMLVLTATFRSTCLHALALTLKKSRMWCLGSFARLDSGQQSSTTLWIITTRTKALTTQQARHHPTSMSGRSGTCMSFALLTICQRFGPTSGSAGTALAAGISEHELHILAFLCLN